eukprot:1500789-Rhodomonas_salina.3
MSGTEQAMLRPGLHRRLAHARPLPRRRVQGHACPIASYVRATECPDEACTDESHGAKPAISLCYQPTIAAYALPRQCPVLTERMLLQATRTRTRRPRPRPPTPRRVRYVLGRPRY